MTTERKTPTCPTCGSADISRDATARWCDETQAWTLSGVFDDVTCDDCGRETSDLDWIDTNHADPSIHVFEISAHAGNLQRGWWVRSAEGLIGPLIAEENAEVECARIEDRRSRLFNCCTHNMPPDWTRYTVLTTGGCQDDPDDPGHTLGLIDDAEAEFWTVYARDKDGCSEAITDCSTRAEVDQIARELSALSGLEIAP